MEQDKSGAEDPREITFYEDLAWRLKLAVEDLPDSKGDIAKAIGVSQQRLSNWITHQNKPDWFGVAKLCQRYRISADWVLLGDVTGLPYRLGARLERAVAEKKAASMAETDQALETIGSSAAPPPRRGRKPTVNKS